MKISTLSKSHIPLIVSLLSHQYYEKDSQIFQRYLVHEFTYNTPLVLGAWCNERLVGVTGAFPRFIRYGSIHLKIAQIGLVVVHPEFRKLGIYSQLLQYCKEAMQKTDISLWLGFTKEAELHQKLLGSDIFQLPEFVLPALMPDSGQANQYTIHRYNRRTHLRALVSMYHHFTLNETGAVVRSHEYWETQPYWSREDQQCFLVAEHKNKPVAYLRVKTSKGVHRIIETVYIAGEEACLDVLLYTIVSRKPEGKWLLCAPLQHALVQRFLSLKAQQIMSESLNISILDPLQLFRHIKPELERKLQASYLQKDKIDLSLNDQTIHIEASHGELIIERSLSEARIKLSHHDLLTLVFAGYDHVHLSREDSPLLGSIFPSRQFVYWHTDRM